MPVYEYACTECGEQLEVRQSFTDAALTVCPVCSGRLRKVLSPVGVVFKGSGFYRTDSRAAQSGSNGSGDPGTDGKGGDDGKAKQGADGGGKDATSGKGTSDSPAGTSAAGSGSGPGKDTGGSSKPGGTSKASSTAKAGTP